MSQIVHRFVQGDGVRLHVACSGEGPAVVMLHGFPEQWQTWQHQIPALAAAGFSVYAPDLRGYNESERPTHRGAYHIAHLVADVAAVVRATGRERAHIVGHDWGGMLTWAFADSHPELVNRLAILNAPHMALFHRRLRRPSRQWLRSWYLVLFQMPTVAEWMISRKHFGLLRNMFSRKPARPAFTTEDVDRYIEALSRPGALTTALRWYRDNASGAAAAQLRSARTTARTLVIWGEQDAALGIDLLDGLEQYAPAVHVHKIPEASHWVQNEAPDAVNRALIEFLSAP